MLGLQPQGLDTLSSNSFILGGHYGRYSNSSSDTLINDAFLIKNEISGITKWFKKYHINGRYFHLTSVTVLRNKDILAFGTAFSLLEQWTKNGVILRTDSNGFVKNLKLYPQQTMEASLALKNGDVAVLSCDSNRFLKLFVIDTTGSVKWSKKYISAGQGAFGGVSLKEGKNGAILILGYKAINKNGFLILSDSSGNKIQDLIYNSWYSYFNGATNYFDEGYYIVGSFSSSMAPINSTIFKFDNFLNLKSYGSFCSNNDHTQFYDIATARRNSLVVLATLNGHGGMRSSLTFMDTNSVIKRGFLFTRDTLGLYSDKIRFTRQGRLLFNVYSPIKNYFGITDTTSNGFCGFKDIVYANTTSSLDISYNTFTAVTSSLTFSTLPVFTYLPTDAIVEYTCSSGPFAPLDTAITPPISTTDVGISVIENDKNITVFPSPANEVLTIETGNQNQNTFTTDSKISLYNSLGECVHSTKILHSDKKITIDIEHFPIGIYFLELIGSANETHFKKILINR